MECGRIAVPSYAIAQTLTDALDAHLRTLYARLAAPRYGRRSRMTPPANWFYARIAAHRRNAAPGYDPDVIAPARPTGPSITTKSIPTTP